MQEEGERKGKVYIVHISDTSIPTTAHDLDLSGQIDKFLICMICMMCMICIIWLMLPGWKPYDLHDLVHVSWVGSVLYRSADKELD